MDLYQAESQLAPPFQYSSIKGCENFHPPEKRGMRSRPPSLNIYAPFVPWYEWPRPSLYHHPHHRRADQQRGHHLQHPERNQLIVDPRYDPLLFHFFFDLFEIFHFYGPLTLLITVITVYTYSHNFGNTIYHLATVNLLQKGICYDYV